MITRGLELGWKAPESSRINTDCLCSELSASGERELPGRGEREKEAEGVSENQWKFSVKVTELWVPLETVTIVMSEDPAPYLYCFLKYRFFNSGETVHICMHIILYTYTCIYIYIYMYIFLLRTFCESFHKILSSYMHDCVMLRAHCL